MPAELKHGGNGVSKARGLNGGRLQTRRGFAALCRALEIWCVLKE